MIPAGLDARPLIVALGGPNGAGKTTFYNVFLRQVGLRFVNADDISRELGVEPYTAAAIAGALRNALVAQGESFVFETVLSDPVGDKIALLRHAATAGYTVVLCYIGIAGPTVSGERVAMRASQGGHDVPAEKLRARFPRTLANLKLALRVLPHVLVFDNGDLRAPYRRVAEFAHGKRTWVAGAVPPWLKPLL